MENNSITLTRKELYKQVWSNSLVALSKQFAMSDNGLRKLCKRMNVPLPSNGHWMKLQFNKKVKVIPLPDDAKVDQTVTLEYRKEGEPVRYENPVKQLVKEIKLAVPEKLISPDPLIVAAKQRLSGKDVRGPHPGIIGCRSDELDIEVAPKHVNRALLFMDALIKALRARQHDIKIENWKTYVVVHGEKLQLKIREKMKRVVINDRDWGNTELQATEQLCFRVDGYYGREWTDSKDGVTLLESKFAEIIAWLEVTGKRLAEEMEGYRRQWKIQEAEEEKKKLIGLRREAELRAFKDLVAAAGRWKQAEMIRDYVTASVGHGAAPAWVEWAKKKANWVDPVVQEEDGVLGRYGEGGK